MKTVVIADLHRTFRSSLKKSLKDFHIVGEPEDANSISECLQRKKPDLLILDLSFIDYDVVSISEIKQFHTDIKIVAMSMDTPPENKQKALEQVIDGFFLKDSTINDLRVTIKGIFECKEKSCLDK